MKKLKAAIFLIVIGVCIASLFFSHFVLKFEPNYAILFSGFVTSLAIWVIYEVFRYRNNRLINKDEIARYLKNRPDGERYSSKKYEMATYAGNYFCCNGCGKPFKVGEEILVDKKLNIVFCSSKENRRRCMSTYLERSGLESDLKIDIKAVSMKFHGNT